MVKDIILIPSLSCKELGTYKVLSRPVQIDVAYKGTLSGVGNDFYRLAKGSRLNLRDSSEAVYNVMRNNGDLLAYKEMMSWVERDLNNVFMGGTSGLIKLRGSISMREILLLEALSGTNLVVLFAYDRVVKGLDISAYGFTLSDGSDVSIYASLPVGGVRVCQDEKSGSTGVLRRSEGSSNVTTPLVHLDVSKIKHPIKLPQTRYKIGTNVWMNSGDFTDIFTSYDKRRSEENVTKSAFVLVNGVENKSDYLIKLNDLYSSDCVIIDSMFEAITPNDITKLRASYKDDDTTQYVLSLCKSLGLSVDCYALLSIQFIDMVKWGSLEEPEILKVFWSIKQCVQVGKKNLEDRVALYFMMTSDIGFLDIISLYLLSCIMFDVYIFNPQKFNISRYSEFKFLYKIEYEHTLKVDAFPVTLTGVTIGTTAKNAERELDTLLFDGSAGIYRDRQHMKSRIVFLDVTQDEIGLLWNSEVKLRQGFNVTNQGVVTVPTLFVEVQGVEGRDISKYNEWVSDLASNKACHFVNQDYFDESFQKDELDRRHLVGKVLVGRKLSVKAFNELTSVDYKYGILSDDVQAYLIEKLQALLDSDIFKGVYKNGTEAIIIDMFLRLSTESWFVTELKNLNLTGIMPKLIVNCMMDSQVTLNSMIAFCYFAFLGFDVVFLVPTCNNILSKFVEKKPCTTIRVGEAVEPFSINLHVGKKKGFFQRLFG